MIRLFHLYIPRKLLLLAFSELLIIGIGFFAAVMLGGPDHSQVPSSYALGIAKVLVVVGVFSLCMYYFDYYDTLVISSRREILVRLPQVLGWGTLLLTAIYQVFPRLQLGIFNFLLGLMIVFLLLLLCREAYQWLVGSHVFSQRAVIFGDGTLAVALISEIALRPELGLQVVGYLSPGESPAMAQLKWLGPLSDVSKIVGEHRPDMIVVALKDRRGQMPLFELLALKTKGMRIEDGVEVYERITGKIPVETLTPGWLLFGRGFRASSSYRSVKHVVSVVFSAVALLIVSPIMLAAATLIKLTSPGPVFFRQERVGEDGKVFTILKFRSMREDAEQQSGPQWATAADSRVTPIGRIIRRWRIDELPQFFNVIKGDMDLIGPRPERPFFVDQLRKEIPFYDQRHVIKPGITGWAQLKWGYADNTTGSLEKLQYDLHYIKNISLGFDLVITLLTIKTVLFGQERILHKDSQVIAAPDTESTSATA